MGVAVAGSGVATAAQATAPTETMVTKSNQPRRISPLPASGIGFVLRSFTIDESPPATQLRLNPFSHRCLFFGG